ncbi:MAG: ribosome silencing factor [Treponema sp.]|jgi:ribosome-associated protein|nr:ribosome silencing factor [Treponema sp.]
MLREDRETALALGKLLAGHRCADVTVLDLSRLDAWTDFFVIATVSSGAHLSGLERHIGDFSRERALEILRRSRRTRAEDDEWRLIDMGGLVVHLMSRKARSFYELERLWSAAEVLFRED